MLNPKEMAAITSISNAMVSVTLMGVTFFRKLAAALA